MDIFRRGKEREPTPSEPKWQRATWDGQEGWAQRDPEDPESWKFSVTLPDDIDPETVKLGYTSDPDPEIAGKYTVSYKLSRVGVWKLLEISETSDNNNIISEFSAHMPRELERYEIFIDERKEPLNL